MNRKASSRTPFFEFVVSRTSKGSVLLTARKVYALVCHRLVASIVVSGTPPVSNSTWATAEEALGDFR